jgi:hypothetical protein
VGQHEIKQKVIVLGQLPKEKHPQTVLCFDPKVTAAAQKKTCRTTTSCQRASACWRESTKKRRHDAGPAAMARDIDAARRRTDTW